MKSALITVIAILLLNLHCNNVSAQTPADSSLQQESMRSLKHDQYLEKSHNQKVAATIMGIAGSAMLLTGLALAASGVSHLFEPGYSAPDYGDAPSILAATGVGLCVGSIILYSSSKKNKKLANLYIGEENVMIIPGVKHLEVASFGIRMRLR